MDIYSMKHVIDRIAVITDSEENKYSDIPGWDGDCLRESDKSVLLNCKSGEKWFPYSQLRKAEDNQSIYCSTWLLNKMDF